MFIQEDQVGAKGIQGKDKLKKLLYSGKKRITYLHGYLKQNSAISKDKK